MSRGFIGFLVAAASVLLGGVASCSAGDSGGSGSGAGSGGSPFGGLGGVATGGAANGGSGGGMGGSSMGGSSMGGSSMGGSSMGGSSMGGSSMGGSSMGGTGGATCKTPTTLHPPKSGTTDNIYCPFSGADGGKNDYCASGSEHCCEPKATGSVSTCQPLSQPCDTGDTDWQCQDPVADCPTGQKCCGTGTVVKNSDPTCANYAQGFMGTHCAQSCDLGEVEMCTSDSECTAPKTCLPFGTKGAQVGACY